MATTEVVIAFPVVLTIVLVIVQLGLAAHARSVAQAAAQEGAAAARRFDGSAQQAKARTEDYLDQLGPTILQDRSVTAERDTQIATVRVTGTVISVIPGLHLSVEKSASGPVERYVPPSREFTNADASNATPGETR